MRPQTRPHLHTLLAGLLLGLCTLHPVVAADSVPPLINYQGSLTDANGAPMAGVKEMAFNLYDAPTGGNLIWGPQIYATVPLINGKFNVLLGPTDGGGRLITSAFADQTRYLSITIEGKEITPRQQILSTPFAMQAQEASHAKEADHAQVSDQSQNAANAQLLNNKSITDLKLLINAPDYDSGWIYVEKARNYDFNHNLGQQPRNAILWAASDQDGANMYLMDSIFAGNVGWGTWLQRITPWSYRISTGINSAMSAYGEDVHWNWRNDGNGFIRVLMWK